MTDNNDDFNDDDSGTAGDGNAAKALRKQNAKLAADLAARDAELATLRTAQKTTTITEALKANGGKAAWARYAAQEIEGDVTPEAVRNWLETNAAEAFDWTPPDDDLSEAEQANRDGARRVATATRNAPPGESAIGVSRVKDASIAELKAWGIVK